MFKIVEQIGQMLRGKKVCADLSGPPTVNAPTDQYKKVRQWPAHSGNQSVEKQFRRNDHRCGNRWTHACTHRFGKADTKPFLLQMVTFTNTTAVCWWVERGPKREDTTARARSGSDAGWKRKQRAAKAAATTGKDLQLHTFGLFCLFLLLLNTLWDGRQEKIQPSAANGHLEKKRWNELDSTKAGGGCGGDGDDGQGLKKEEGSDVWYEIKPDCPNHTVRTSNGFLISCQGLAYAWRE